MRKQSIRYVHLVVQLKSKITYNTASDTTCSTTPGTTHSTIVVRLKV